MGYRVREYAPVGDLLPGMAYLVRRLLENTSNESWLRGKFAEGKSLWWFTRRSFTKIPGTRPQLYPKRSFQNEPFLDFAIEKTGKKCSRRFRNSNLTKMSLLLLMAKRSRVAKCFHESILLKLQKSLPMSLLRLKSRLKKLFFLHIITGKIGKSSSLNEGPLLRKNSWRDDGQKFELAATQVFEVGKPWAEADADVAEAMDFAGTMQAQAKEIFKTQKVGGVPGENSEYIYKSRGVTAVISPGIFLSPSWLAKWLRRLSQGILLSWNLLSKALWWLWDFIKF